MKRSESHPELGFCIRAMAPKTQAYFFEGYGLQPVHLPQQNHWALAPEGTLSAHLAEKLSGAKESLRENLAFRISRWRVARDGVVR
jgi:hypothetical protein